MKQNFNPEFVMEVCVALAPLIPLVPALLEAHDGEVAGTGAAVRTGVVLPPDELEDDSAPTLAEFVEAGYDPAAYPPPGYEPVQDADYAAELQRRAALAPDVRKPKKKKNWQNKG